MFNVGDIIQHREHNYGYYLLVLAIHEEYSICAYIDDGAKFQLTKFDYLLYKKVS